MWQNRQTWQIAAILAITVLVQCRMSLGGKAYRHRGRRPSACCIPSYNYDMHPDPTIATVVAIAPVGQPQTIEPDASSTRSARTPGNLRKAFFVDRASIATENVTLSRIASAFYDDGRYNVSGLVSFDGGPDGALEGANVRISIRAYSGTAQHAGRLDNMRLLWVTQQSLWIGRGQSRTISLLPAPRCTKTDTHEGIQSAVHNTSPAPPSKLIREHFEETTHLEIVLEHLKDR